ncbi:uncharacterized protein LOC135395749 [Ornithodoros turicata]|uniref:uncharacterized protein LOC135395749 n=1 Tax=Ornithodoros turicata TaxID=34597 RepID=UPI00313A11B3
MTISTEKSVVLPFTRSNMHPFPLSVAGVQLRSASFHRFLGVTVDARLSWVKHIASLEAKVHRWIAVIRHLARVKWGSAMASLLAVHRALVRGSLAYSLPVLNGLPPSSVQKLQCLLARSLRVCLGVPRAAETHMVIAEAKEAPLQVLRYRETCRQYTSAF